MWYLHGVMKGSIEPILTIDFNSLGQFTTTVSHSTYAQAGKQHHITVLGLLRKL